ncbi:MAG: threonine--tRNA ligase [Candidatus Omnitrophica bacterium]|nr:threonine--tRNA ligase [Candidatus Omnitrophota bacterium]
MLKTNEQYTDLDKLRHSCAHVMAHAVKELFPDAKLGVGPPVEDGFYYDIDCEHTFTPEDLEKIGEKMEEIVRADHRFEKEVLPREKAKEFFFRLGEEYKLEIINQIDPAEAVSIYRDGGFVDLCRGPHVESTGKIKAFKLLSIAGAYWKGDPNNKMMQRIYGTAFYSKEELQKFLRMREEAKKRDHRKLGKELDFFSIQDDGGPGLVFYHPKGALLRYLIEEFIKKEHLKRGYQFVMGPQILKSDIWVRSGHYAYYKQNMFVFKTEENKEYAVKPMNCPGHMLIYKTKVRSFRDLPLRFFEMGNVCRNEKSGVLHGLLRVRNFTQDDAHIFCMPEQLEGEIASVIGFVFDVLRTFGFEEHEIELSTRPANSIGTDADWEKATQALEGALRSKGIDYKICKGEGAFYGPKIDIKIKDAIGRAWQCSTIQCDFALPERFDLEYTGSDGARRRPAMIHRAILGSVERFMGTLLEHYGGALPLWLSPVQVSVIPIAKPHEDYAAGVLKVLAEAGCRAEMKDSSETLGARIRDAQREKIPYMLVVGDKETAAQNVSVRSQSRGDLGTMGFKEFVEKLKQEVDNRGLVKD